MNYLNEIFGTEAKELVYYQMSARAVLIFFVSLALMRISGFRMLGKMSVFDNLTILMLGSILGRAIVTSQSLTGTFFSSVAILLLHHLIGYITYKSSNAGSVFKGNPIELIKDHKHQDENMRKTHITRHDIFESLRDSLNTNDYSKIKDAYLERSGKITIVKE